MAYKPAARSELGDFRILREVGRAIAQYYVALAETQVGEQALHVGDPLERTEHHDDIAL